MKFYLALGLSVFILLVPGLSNASYIEYCKGTLATNPEDAVIQRLVPQFAHAMHCEVGDNCLLKWDVKPNSEKFSIAWKEVCGPVINGKNQLGDNGKGSTFVCEIGNKGSVCCSPLGFKNKAFRLCSDTIIKQQS